MEDVTPKGSINIQPRKDPMAVIAGEMENMNIPSKINHLAKVVWAARTFIASLLADLRAAEDDVVVVTNHIRANLAWIRRYLATENSKAIIPHNRTVLRIWADTSLKGGGGGARTG